MSDNVLALVVFSSSRQASIWVKTDAVYWVDVMLKYNASKLSIILWAIAAALIKYYIHHHTCVLRFANLNIYFFCDESHARAVHNDALKI